MKILVACEESQAVTKELRRLGHEAYSCDIIECSGGHPEWHIRWDALAIINGNCSFMTCDGELHHIDGQWDLLIAHPPCQYLSVAGNGYLNVEKYGQAALQRIQLREEAADFFMAFINADCERVCVENPVGYMNTKYKKPDQTVHPYFFAEDERDEANYHKKRTCLWLKGLDPLERTTFLPEPQPIYVDKLSGKKRYYCDAISGDSKDGAKKRSKTFPGIAKAMAEQWAGDITGGTK
jgi:hypothetical protein